MATNRAYDISCRSVARTLGLELAELDDWNCCGATAYIAINEKQSFVLSARNLALAEAQSAPPHPTLSPPGRGQGEGGHELIVICNGCYVTLHKAEKYLAEDASLRQQVQGALRAGGMDYRNSVHVRHFLDVMVRDVGEEEIRRRVKQPLSGWKVAPYPGCQIGRPFGEIDDPEFPTLLDRLLTWLGAEVVPFGLKAKCCGGMMMTTQPAVGRNLSGKILTTAKDAGAEYVATACPLCHINLEAYQNDISAALGADCHISVLYFTQLMGLAFGLDAKELALADNLTPLTLPSPQGGEGGVRGAALAETRG
jgi:heterodisulfide reductase subunit B